MTSRRRRDDADPTKPLPSDDEAQTLSDFLSLPNVVFTSEQAQGGERTGKIAAAHQLLKELHLQLDIEAAAQIKHTRDAQAKLTAACLNTFCKNFTSRVVLSDPELAAQMRLVP